MSATLFLTTQTDVNQRLVDFERAGQRSSAVVANFIICNSDHQRCEWQNRGRARIARTVQTNLGQRRVALERVRQLAGAVVGNFVSLNPNQTKDRRQSQTSPPNKRKKSALTAQVDVDNCFVFLEQFVQRLGAVVADFVCCTQEKSLSWRPNKRRRRSHDKSTLFTDVLLTSAVASALARSPRISFTNAQVFIYFSKKTTVNDGKIRGANSLLLGKRMLVSDAFCLSASANAWTPSSPKLFPEQDKKRLDNLQRAIEGIDNPLTAQVNARQSRAAQ